MDDIKYDFGIPLPLLKELKQRDALPLWWETVSSKLGSDWLDNFHKSFTQEGWPVEVKKADVGVVDTTLNPFAYLGQEKDSIVFPASLVPIFWEIANCVFGHMQFPNSADPNAKMSLSKQSEEKSLNDLRALFGRLKYTACPSMTVEHPFIPIVIATSHYIYCHEVAHVALSRKFKEVGSSSRQEEFECDRVAFAMMTSTYRSIPDFQQAFSLTGPALAFGLERIKSYLSDHASESNITHPNPEERYNTLREWCIIGEHDDMIVKGATELADFFWSYLQRLMKILESENNLFAFNPVRKTLNSLFIYDHIRSDDIFLMTTNIIQWCSFGNQNLVKESLKEVLDEYSLTKDCIVSRNINLFKEDLIYQTAHLEQILGFENLLKN